MSSTRISEDFKIEIPIEVRDAMKLEVGQEVAWLPVGNTFRLVRVKTLQELRGTLKGDWSDYRDETDREL